ncbi:hypothetical protein ATO6_18000 [Oceanicola sp. 22II-s10i]|nr:hypothetical protein ATO6_18000 [Oceanicola sp. 22II-s10i]
MRAAAEQRDVILGPDPRTSWYIAQHHHGAVEAEVDVVTASGGPRVRPEDDGAVSCRSDQPQRGAA